MIQAPKKGGRSKRPYSGLRRVPQPPLRLNARLLHPGFGLTNEPPSDVLLREKISHHLFHFIGRTQWDKGPATIPAYASLAFPLAKDETSARGVWDV